MYNTVEMLSVIYRILFMLYLAKPHTLYDRQGEVFIVYI